MATCGSEVDDVAEDTIGRALRIEPSGGTEAVRRSAKREEMHVLAFESVAWMHDLHRRRNRVLSIGRGGLVG
jgi:hypothetical protein